MKVHEIMTAHARCVGPENTLVEAAGLMRELDVGALPVCDDENRLAGMVTDRDMVLRGTADGCDPNSTLVRDVMSLGVEYIFADEPVETAVELMERKQIRRLPVMSRRKHLVGIVSLGDVAMSSNPAFSGMALRDVSQPAAPTARQRQLVARSEPAGTLKIPGARKRPGARSGGTTHKAKSQPRRRAAVKKPQHRRSTKSRARTAAR